MSKTRPQIVLNQAKILCNKHRGPWCGLHLHARELHLVAFSIELFNVLVADKDFQKKCGNKTANIDKFMPKPLCCWVETHYPEKLFEAYLKLGVAPPVSGNLN